MNILPKVKECSVLDGTINLEKIKWDFSECFDERVTKAAERIKKSNEDGVLVKISHGAEDTEGYTIKITDEVNINAKGAAGAFYALQTLGMLTEENEGEVSCCEIKDYPDMQYRGFYHDITRGKIPTLDRLKSLVDELSRFKINSLQLYVEHVYEFREYSYLNGKLGYITKEEIKELDAYCTERFIELIPSLATFGHLYHLMESPEYKHLCELSDFIPNEHYFIARLRHHTINPLLDESFEVIKSIIDQHIEAFSSDKFNICCDETIDLCRGVNKDKAEQKGKLYVDFVIKLSNYLKSIGKTVMMWGDILSVHPECIENISEDVILLDWAYEAEPDIEKRRIFSGSGRKFVVCPATSSWYDFSEDIAISEKNIKNVSHLGHETNAYGMLTTNWGDYGHIASLETVYHGIILGAACSWDKTAASDDEFKRLASRLYYGNDDTINVLSDVRKIREYYHWGRLIGTASNWKPIEKTEADFIENMAFCKVLRERIENAAFKSENVKDDLIMTIEGHALLLKWLSVKEGFNVECFVDFDKWVTTYEQNWLRDNKSGELKEVLRLFKVLDGRKTAKDYKKAPEEDEIIKLYPDID